MTAGTATLNDLAPQVVWSRNAEGRTHLARVVVKLEKARECKGSVVVGVIVEMQDDSGVVHRVSQELIVGNKLTLELPK